MVKYKRWQNRVLDKLIAEELRKINLAPIVHLMQLCPADVKKLTRLIETTASRYDASANLPDRVAEWREAIEKKG